MKLSTICLVSCLVGDFFYKTEGSVISRVNRSHFSWPYEGFRSNRMRRGLNSLLEIIDYHLISELTTRRLNEFTHDVEIVPWKNHNQDKKRFYSWNNNENTISSKRNHHSWTLMLTKSTGISIFRGGKVEFGQCDFDSECRWFCESCDPQCHCIDGVCDCP